MKDQTLEIASPFKEELTLSSDNEKFDTKATISNEFIYDTNSESPSQLDLRDMQSVLYGNLNYFWESFTGVCIRIKLYMEKRVISEVTSESIADFLVGFLLGFFLNLLGFAILNSLKNKRAKKKGFLVGCLFSFVFYLMFCIVVSGYLNQVQRQKTDFLKRNKNHSKRFHPVQFSTYLHQFQIRTFHNIKMTILFWRKEEVVKTSKISHKQKDINRLRNKRLQTIHRLRNTFNSKYNF